jgi:hypothetical protein
MGRSLMARMRYPFFTLTKHCNTKQQTVVVETLNPLLCLLPLIQQAYVLVHLTRQLFIEQQQQTKTTTPCLFPLNQQKTRVKLYGKTPVLIP